MTAPSAVADYLHQCRGNGIEKRAVPYRDRLHAGSGLMLASADLTRTPKKNCHGGEDLTGKPGGSFKSPLRDYRGFGVFCGGSKAKKRLSGVPVPDRESEKI